MKTTIALLGLIGFVSLAAPARAGELDVCHMYAEARYQEAMALDDSGLRADLDYGDAYDDCSAGLPGFVWRNAPLSDIAGDYNLIVDPWTEECVDNSKPGCP